MGLLYVADPADPADPTDPADPKNVFRPPKNFQGRLYACERTEWWTVYGLVSLVYWKLAEMFL